MTTLGPEASRQTGPVRCSFTEFFRSVLTAPAWLPTGKSAAEKRKKAITVFSSMVGAMVIAPAVDHPSSLKKFCRSSRHPLRCKTHKTGHTCPA
jgi:TetR/AcrR family transcriptional repressor of nem operon